MAESAPTFYVLHGEDTLSRDEEIAKLRARFADGLDAGAAEMNTTILDGKNATLDDIKSACDAFPFLSDRRLVIITGFVGGLKGKALDALEDYLEVMPGWARLFLVEDKALPARHSILRLAQTHKRGYEKAFNPPKDATNWIRRRAPQEHGAEITPAAAAALAEVVGTDLHAADSELSKLAAYVNGARPIDVQDVHELTSYVAEANIFEMVDRLVSGDGRGAAERLHRLLETQDPLSLLGMVVRQFRLLLLAKTYLDDGGSPAGLADAIGVHPYAARKLPGQARKFSSAQLEAIYRQLLDYDLQIKTGRIEPVLALDLLAATLAI
ncbi:MAG: DNA polymerase III subunit delta [Anaerolineae bacterium]|nr:DNA polymerase III subunit delta [Anaerolineae bacterium]